MRRASALASNVALALASTVLGLLVFEIGFRVLAAREDRHDLSDALATAPPVDPARELQFRQMIRLSADPAIVYELVPGVKGRYLGASVEINAAGFRDAELPQAAAPGAFRIVGLGDSFLFGWRLPPEQDWLSQLEARLREAHPEIRWETINTGVPGYNTVMEVATLERKALAYAPDLVVLGLVANDLDLPNFLHTRRDPGSLARSFLWDALRERARQPGNWPTGLAPAPRPPEGGNRFEYAPERIAPEHRHLVGWEAHAGALKRLAELAAAGGFDVIVLALDPEPSDSMRRSLAHAEGLDFGVVDLAGRLRAHLSATGQAEYARSDLVMRPDDLHPSPRAHAMAAEALHRAMLARGLVGRARARTASR